jgi:subtilisin-like proprotein convertase family protein
MRLVKLSLAAALGVLALSAGSAGAATYSNPAAITIPDSGTATPYPSTISVPTAGTITKVTVTLSGFNHAFPDDVGVLLVGPSTARAELMDGVAEGMAATSLTFTFDDAAAATLPCNDVALASGTYKPTDCDPLSETYAAPAPAGPHGELLSAFNGTNQLGTWSLYVQDFNGGDGGSISGGWSLTITSSATAVRMTGFTATANRQGALLRWRTASELDTLGFNVYRQANGRRVRVNTSLIGAHGRGSYSFLDRSPARGRVTRYWLQVVDLDGSRSWYGPARLVLRR